MMTRTVFILLISSLCTLSYCTPRTEPAQTEVLTPVDSISKDSAVIVETLPPRIEIEKELLYDKHTLAYIIHSGFISGYQNRYGDNLKPPTNVYHRMTA